MADVLADGTTRLSWVPTIANTSAPTAAELNAGVALESFVTRDGFEQPTTTGKADSTPLSGLQTTALVGNRTDELKLTLKQQGKANPPWSTFAANPSGYIVRRSDIAASTAWAASQKVTVFPCQVGYRDESNPAENAVAKFTVDFIITGPVVDNATTA